MYNVGDYRRKLQICKFCKKICTSNVWTHTQECKKVPEEEKKLMKLPKYYIMMVPSVEKDWKDFIERKFEPHTFRARWNNIKCPYFATNIVKIYITPLFAPLHQKVGNKSTKRLHFGKASSMQCRFKVFMFSFKNGRAKQDRKDGNRSSSIGRIIIRHWVGRKESNERNIHRRSFCELYELWKVGSCTFWKYLPKRLSPRQKGYPR